MKYRCEVCGKPHDDLPDLGMHAPDPYLAVAESERAERTTFTPDRCTVHEHDGMHYFIRGVIFIPVHGRADPFGLGVWVSQSRTNYERYAANEPMSPTFGWLVNRIGYYRRDTFALETSVHFLGEGLRPKIELAACDHPLALDQQNGISLARAWDIVHSALPN